MTRSLRQHMMEHEISSEPGALFARFTVAPDLPVFKGHFPNRPLFPGFLLIQLVIEYALELAGRPLQVRSIDKARFHSPVLPGDTLNLSVRHDAAGDRVSATFRKQDTKVAVVRISFSFP